MRLNIRILQLDEVTENYSQWYSENAVVRFSDNQYQKFSFDGQCQYVAACLENPTLDLYGIFDNDFHIGNIVISDLKSIHKRAEITYVVGERLYWGKGVGTFAVSKIIELAKSTYKLNKLFAGLAEENYGSQRVLEKNGFSLEGRRIKHLFYNGVFYNQLDYGLIL